MQTLNGGAMRIEPTIETLHYGYPLIATTALAIVLSWFYRQARHRFNPADLVLMVCALASAGYLLLVFNTPLRASTGTSFAPAGIAWAAIAGSLLILELTRRVAGLALVAISAVFLTYVFIGPYLPGFLGYPGLSLQRFLARYIPIPVYWDLPLPFRRPTLFCSLSSRPFAGVQGWRLLR